MPLALACWRIGKSLIRRRSRRLAEVSVDIGGVRVIVNLRTPLGLRLYRFGFCAAEARVCGELLRPGDVFVDGGANIGLFALACARIVGSEGRVLACEPSPGTIELLRKNTRANRLPAMNLHQVALGADDGTARFTMFEAGSGLASFAPEIEGGHTIDVAVTTLDRLTAGFGDRVALVKLDIEGAEAKALQGASELIARSAPLFVLEVEPAHLARQGSSVEDLMAVMQPHGYEAYAITPDARLAPLQNRWCPPETTSPNLVLASGLRLPRLKSLLTRGPSGV